jgi:seryl-tRNA synthetase
MLDIKFIRENKDAVAKTIRDKRIDLDLEELLLIDENRRSALGRVEELRTKRNEIANDIKMGKRSDDLISEGKNLKIEISKKENEYNEINEKFFELMVKVPTIPSSDTPIGKDETGNVEIYIKGEKPVFDFAPKNHIELGEELDIIDFDRGVRLAGFRGYYLKNEGSLLVMALMMYAFHKMAAKGYAPIIPPTLVKGFALFGSGYFKGEEYNPEIDEIYQIATSDKESSGEASKEKKFLVGTAEPSLLAYFSDEALSEEDLPIKVCGFSPCYRSEIGSYGKDTKGLYRVHEFMKIEQVVVSKANIDESTKLQEEMISISEEIHQELGLPYRKLQICTGDMSAGKFRAFDLEAWMPGLNRWGETGSASNFLDWQARRLNVKYTDCEGNKKFAYLLNNTAMPSVRPLIAIIENYQQADGSILIPDVLKKYLPDGLDRITKNNKTQKQ